MRRTLRRSSLFLPDDYRHSRKTADRYSSPHTATQNDTIISPTTAGWHPGSRHLESTKEHVVNILTMLLSGLAVAFVFCLFYWFFFRLDQYCSEVSRRRRRRVRQAELNRRTEEWRRELARADEPGGRASARLCPAMTDAERSKAIDRLFLGRSFPYSERRQHLATHRNSHSTSVPTRFAKSSRKVRFADTEATFIESKLHQDDEDEEEKEDNVRNTVDDTMSHASAVAVEEHQSQCLPTESETKRIHPDAQPTETHVPTQRHPSQLQEPRQELPTAKNDDSLHAQHESQCSICLLEYESEDLVVIGTSCIHMFHHSCAIQWLKQRDSNADCPVCRSPFL